LFELRVFVNIVYVFAISIVLSYKN